MKIIVKDRPERLLIGNARKSETTQMLYRDRVQCMFPQVFSLASGKGGVGKTSIAVNLAFAFTRLGKRVLLLDADLGLGNIDVLLGLTPQYTLEHLFEKSKTIADISIKGPGGVFIVPASRGMDKLVNLEDHQKLSLLNEIDLIAHQIDVLLIDNTAGISSNALYFDIAAQGLILISTPEATSIKNTFAVIKVLHMNFKKKRIMILMNKVDHEKEAREGFQKITLMADRFLDHPSIDYLGFIPIDEKLQAAVKAQRAVLEIWPTAPSSRRFMRLAKYLASKPIHIEGNGQIQFLRQKSLYCHPSRHLKGKSD